MKKTPSLFQRNYDGDRKLRDELVPGTEWVVAGEGVATRKFDGTCVLVKDGALWRRYDAKNGKAPPNNWIPAMAEADPVTGHRTGWVPVGDGPNDKWHANAWREVLEGKSLPDGTYELCGPHFQTNHEGLEHDVFIAHRGAQQIPNVPTTFDGLREFLRDFPHEGIVWHRDPARGTDGDMVKVKRCDFWGKA
jgi:hypothetical protein